MALHGTIEVNGESLGWWSAVRGRQNHSHPWPDPDVYPGPVYTYSCEVTFYRDDTTLKFEVDHPYNEGAIALAAKVLDHAWHNEELGKIES